jgi:CubicO group peptidase (beta-lactamase class C family)
MTRFARALMLTILCVGSSIAPAQSSQPRLARPDIEGFSDSVFADYVRQSGAPSLAVIVTTARSVLFEKGYGSEDPALTSPVDPQQTLFNIASVSKLFVTTSVMQLVDAGRLGLDDRVDKYTGGITIRGKVEPVRVRHLLTHTSGIDAPFMRGIVTEPSAVIGLDAYFARYLPRIGREPGNEIRYSNDGMALAALVVERVSGERFDDYAERRIFGPLRMERSSLRQPPPFPLSQRVATAGSGSVPNFLILYPVGSMVSTVADVARFMQAILNDGVLEDRRLLSDTAVRAMLSRQWSAHTAAPGVGLGFFESDLGGRRGMFHSGARTHFSLLYLLPDEDIGIFIVHSMRQGGPFQFLRTEYVRAFVERYFPLPVRGSPAAADPEARRRASRFVGVYRPILLSSSSIERAAWLGMDTPVTANVDGSLNVAIPGGATLRVTEAMPGVYRAREGPNAGLVIAFTAGDDNRPPRMSMSGATQDPVSFEMLAWYHRGTLHVTVLGLAFAIIISLCLVSALRLIVATVRRRLEDHSSGGATPRRIWRLAVLASAIILCAPPAGVVVLILNQSEAGAADGVRLALTTGLSLLLAGCVLALVIPGFSIVAWRRHWWSTADRVHFTVVAVAVVAFIPLLAYYHLLGFWM